MSLEGIAATGKTSIGKELTKLLNNSIYVEEFPAEYLDGYIQRLMEKDQYLQMNPKLDLSISQTYVLMGGTAYKYEAIIKKSLLEGKIVIVDRYIHTILSYQSEILSKIVTDFDKSNWLKSCLDILPQPDIIVYFSISNELLLERLNQRRDKPNEKILNFFMNVDNNFKEILKGDNRVISIKANREGTIHENAKELSSILFKKITMLKA